MLSSLGGVGAILNGVIEGFGSYLIIIFIADLIYMLRKKHKFNLLTFQVTKIKKQLPNLIEAAKVMK